MFILQAPLNLHPFVWRVYFNTFLLVRIPGLFCVRGMFKIFVGKNCRICQLYWCFHQSISSKTNQRDLRNCPQHPKRDLSKGDTVWWALQNCMFLGGQRDIKRWACVWSMVAQNCEVLPCLSYELIVMLHGAYSPRKRHAKYGRGENQLATILSNHDDARDQLFRIFPSGKPGARRREHRVYWFPSSLYWYPICDGRNYELLNSMMTQGCSRNRPHREMSSYELNPPKQWGVNLEGLGGWQTRSYGAILKLIFQGRYALPKGHVSRLRCSFEVNL